MTLNMLATTYSIAFVPLALVGANVIARYGIRRGFLFGCFLNMLGAAIRILPSPFMKSEGTVGLVCVFIGQSICSIAQPFIVSGIMKLSQYYNCRVEGLLMR